MHSWSPFVHFFRLRQAEWKENPEAITTGWHPVGEFEGRHFAAGNDGKIWLGTGHGAMILLSFSTALPIRKNAGRSNAGESC